MKYAKFPCEDAVSILMAYMMGDKDIAKKHSTYGTNELLYEEVEAESMAAAICGSKSGTKRWRELIAEKPGAELAYWDPDYGYGTLYIRTDMFGILKDQHDAKTGEKCVDEKEKSHVPTKLG